MTTSIAIDRIEMASASGMAVALKAGTGRFPFNPFIESEASKMSEVKLDDLSPAPFFARFLEDQFARPLTADEMKAVRGGSSALEQDMVVRTTTLPDYSKWTWTGLAGLPGSGDAVPLPLWSPLGRAPETTMAAPSDSVSVVPN